MKKRPPKYKELNNIYHPDSCQPLIEAVEKGLIKLVALKRFNYPGISFPTGVLNYVNSLGYWDTKIKQTWGLDWHRNEGIEFTFLASGYLDFSLGGKEYKLGPGNLTITRPWQPHKVGNPHITIGKLYWLIIDVGVRQPHQNWSWPNWIVLSPEDLKALTHFLRQNEHPVWNTNNEINRCFSKIGACLEEIEDKIPHSKLNILINQLLLLLLELFKEGEIELDQSLTNNFRTAEIFFQNLHEVYDQPWTLETMAKHCGLGVTSLTKYCKLLTNLSPINYLIKIRLEAAAKMLINSKKKNITEICYECGFSSSQYFATSFKKLFKCTPNNFRP